MNWEVGKESYLSVNDAKLSIEVTTYCNSSCSHCFVNSGSSERSSLSVDLVKEIMVEGSKLGYRHLHVTGGEPLLWDGLLGVLDYAFGMGYETIFMNTNGTLLTREACKILADYNGLAISVSLEGDEAFHAYLRGKDSYRQTVLGIENALDAGIDLIIFTTARKGLIPELPQFADDLYKQFPGIKYLTLIELVRVTYDDFSISKELLDAEDFLKIVRIVSLLNLFGCNIYVLNDPLVNVVSKLIQMPWIPQSQPLIHEGNIIVRANRNIGLSHSRGDSFGKYNPGMIEKVLVSDKYRKAVSPDITTCPLCKYIELCMESCMERPLETYKDTHQGVPYCKEVLDKIAA